MRYFTAGESHGPRLTAIIEGVPAGLPLSSEDINVELKRRQHLFIFVFIFIILGDKSKKY